MNEQDKVTFYLAMQDAGFGATARKAQEDYAKLKQSLEAESIAMGRLHSVALDLNKAFDESRIAAKQAAEDGHKRLAKQLEEEAIKMGKAHSEALQMNAALDKSATTTSQLKTALTALASSYALSQIARGAKQVYLEFAAAESEVVAFNRATQANGISAEGVTLLRDYAEAMRRFGFDDESVLSVEKVALNLGFGAEQAREFARVAIDLGGPLGKIEEAAQALANAHNGNARGLKQFGIYIDEARLKSEGLNAVVAESDRLYKGAGEQMGTAAANVRLLATEWGALKENLGEIVAGSGAIQFLQGLVNLSGSLLEKMKALRSLAGGGDASAAEIPLAASHGGPLPLLSSHSSGTPLVLLPSHGAGAPSGGVRLPVLTDPAKPKSPEQIAKELEAAFAAGPGMQATIAREGGMMAEAVAQWTADQVQEVLDAAATAREGGQMDAVVGQWQREQDERAARQAEETRRLNDEMGSGPEELWDRAIEASAYEAEQAAKRTAELSDEMSELSDQVWLAGVEEGKAGKAASARTMSDMEAAQAAYGFAQTLVGVAQAITSGNAGGALAGIGSMVMQGGAAAKQPYVFAAGAALSLLGGGMGNGEPRTQGERGRRQLKDILAGANFWDDATGTFIKGDFQTRAMDPAALAATGQADMWQKWAEAIGGPNMGEGAEILAGAFQGLNLSAGQAANSIGHLIAQSQGLSEAAGDQIAAQEALLSNAALTADQLSELALLYGDSSAYLAEEARLRKEIMEDAQAYRDYVRAGGKEQSGAAWEELQRDREAYVALMAQNAADQQKSDAELQAAFEAKGLSSDDARQQVLSTKGVESNTARMVVLLESMAGVKMNDSDVGGVDYDNNPRTPGLARARYAPPRGSVAGGGRGRTIVVVQHLDGREIARTVHHHTEDLRELGEVA